MPKARMTSKGQVTIPKSIRERLHLRKGAHLDFRVEEDGSVRLVALTRTVDEVYGILRRPDGEALSVEEMDAGVADRMRRRHGKNRG
jgi:antitoxin PrlF